jgi:glutamine amidotransferase
VSDGATIWAFRYSTQGRTRSLFHSADIGTLREMYPDVERLHLFSDEAHVVVSEPTTDLPGSFIEVPEASLVVLDDSGYHQQAFTPLAVG